MKISRILIHHHAIACVENTEIWIQSFIGAWVQELSLHFDEIGLLVHVSDNKRDEQDYAIKANNVRVHRLNPSKRLTFLQRNQYVRQVCKSVSPNYDVLLIRGITPRQKLVFDHCAIEQKCYLLVGSLIENKPIIRLNIVSFITWVLYKQRRRELRTISRGVSMFANSPALIQEIFTVFGIKASFMPTNTISKSDFKPLDTKDIRRPVRILFCGRVVKEKGIEELIGAIRILIDKYTPVYLDVIGSIKSNYKRRLFKNIDRLKLRSQIKFHGFVPFGENLLKLYSNADVFVLPSWHEGFPHSIWEAAATSTPVIVTPVGGIPGIIKSEHALFCKVKNSEALAKAILECLTDTSATKSRIKSLYHLALNYTIENCARTTYNLIVGEVR